jgi:hypothetical protein
MYIPVIPFTTDVGANAKDGIHAGLLDLAEEPHDVVVPREVVLKLEENNISDGPMQHDLQRIGRNGMYIWIVYSNVEDIYEPHEGVAHGRSRRRRSRSC